MIILHCLIIFIFLIPISYTQWTFAFFHHLMKNISNHLQVDNLKLNQRISLENIFSDIYYPFRIKWMEQPLYSSSPKSSILSSSYYSTSIASWNDAYFATIAYNLQKMKESIKNDISSSTSCMACFAIAELYKYIIYSKPGISGAIKIICISLRLQKPEVCDGIAKNYEADLDYIGLNTNLTPNEMCATLIGKECAVSSDPSINWYIILPEKTNKKSKNLIISFLSSISPPLSLDSASTIFSSSSLSSSSFPSSPLTSSSDLLSFSTFSSSFSSPSKSIPSTFLSKISSSLSASLFLSSQCSSLSPLSSLHLYSSCIYKIVHLTDIHVDVYYTPGSISNCGKPVCCREMNGDHYHNNDHHAGPWGDYGHCDTPIATFIDTLQNIAKNHADADYWLWTGDIGPHDIWNATKEDIIFHIRLITSLIKRFSLVPVFPVIGNHEGFPSNSFPPPEITGDLSVSWLYKVLAEEWSYWLPTTAIETLKIGGYYTVPFRTGFRIIAINTNYCARLNPWTLYNNIDPGGQLKWLTSELYEAELIGDKVHIIGHIAPDNRECTEAWIDNYLAICERFQETIVSQFFGHTHRDEFRVYYSPNNYKPISIGYIAPSLASFKGNNPAYRIYYTDEQANILNHETYFFNLTQANNHLLGPVWKREYSVRDDYTMLTLNPQDWDHFIHRLINNDQDFQLFYSLYSRFSDSRNNESCSLLCKNEIISELKVLPSNKQRSKLFTKKYA